eukprot:5784267-Pyramimonas_sp.AAC.1
MSAGISVAFPGHEIQRIRTYDQSLGDAHALDCRIRPAIEAFGLLGNWLEGLGTEVSKTVRDTCSSAHETIVFIRALTDQPQRVELSLDT